jgi:glycosyltransferase involved in cell wall biosynthesis
MRRVALVQELLPHYRVPFFERLRAELAGRSIELQLFYGVAAGTRAAHADEVALPWATRLDNRRPFNGRVPIVYQSAFKGVGGADLVIVEAANRLALTYLLLATAKAPSRPRVAFWGHGGNLQASHHASLKERFKRVIARAPHWWFAYTQGSADRVVATGFPANRTTVVQNAVETSHYAVAIPRQRTPLACAYVGSLHEYKRIQFLLDAASILADLLEGFSLTVLGDGPERSRVESASRSNSWLDYRGPQTGQPKVDLLLSSQLLLMPGLVGLAAVEALAAGTPIVTTDIPYHSPEFEYLTAANSLVLPKDASPADYASGVAQLLGDQQRMSMMRAACAETAKVVTIDQMVVNFADGVVAALE